MWLFIIIIFVLNINLSRISFFIDEFFNVWRIQLLHYLNGRALKLQILIVHFPICGLVMSLRLILECFIIIATSLCFLRFIFCQFRLIFFSLFIYTASLLICLSFSKSFMLFMLLRAISFFLFFLTFFIFYFAAVFHLRILLVVGRTLFLQNYFLVGFGNRIF